MTNNEKNSAGINNLTREEEKIFSRIEQAITDEETIRFEKSLHKTFPRKTIFQKHWIRAAAIFVAIVSLGFWVYYYCVPVNKKLFSEYYAHFSVDNVSGFTRGNEALKNKAYQVYGEQKYEDAAELFSRLLERQPANFEARFLLSVCYIEMRNYSKAEMHLESLLLEESHFYTDDANWYLALLKVRKAQYTEAGERLRSIGQNSVYFLPANELLGKIENQ